MNIAVIGPGLDAREADLTVAHEVGALIAAEGWVLVTGGMDGVMEAATRGAVENGGVVVGLLPGLDPSSANDSVSIALPTGLGEARNIVLVNATSGVICVGGSWGTLIELSAALRTGKPVVQIGGWKIVTDGGLAPEPAPEVAETASDALDRLKLMLT